MKSDLMIFKPNCVLKTECREKGETMANSLKIYWWYGSGLTLYLQFMSHCHITTHHFGKHTQKFTYNFSLEKGFWKSSDRDKWIGHSNFDQVLTLSSETPSPFTD